MEIFILYSISTYIFIIGMLVQRYEGGKINWFNLLIIFFISPISAPFILGLKTGETK